MKLSTIALLSLVSIYPITGFANVCNDMTINVKNDSNHAITLTGFNKEHGEVTGITFPYTLNSNASISFNATDNSGNTPGGHVTYTDHDNDSLNLHFGASTKDHDSLCDPHKDGQDSAEVHADVSATDGVNSSAIDSFTIKNGSPVRAL